MCVGGRGVRVHKALRVIGIVKVSTAWRGPGSGDDRPGQTAARASPSAGSPRTPRARPAGREYSMTITCNRGSGVCNYV
eukprot:2896938-Prymnesium_polylepis.1